MKHGWAEHVLHDVGFEAYSRRLSKHLNLLVTKADFTEADALKALTQGDEDLVNRAGGWLRDQLSNLRRRRKQKEGAIIRLRKAMSEILIADIALTLLEASTCNVPDNLISLLQELLGVDKHRQALAKDVPLMQKAAAVQAQIGQRMGVRAVAKIVGCSPDTISRWRKSAEFRALVEAHQEAFASFRKKSSVRPF